MKLKELIKGQDRGESISSDDILFPQFGCSMKRCVKMMIRVWVCYTVSTYMSFYVLNIT